MFICSHFKLTLCTKIPANQIGYYFSLIPCSRLYSSLFCCCFSLFFILLIFSHCAFFYKKIINIFQHCKQVTQNGRNDGIPSYRLNGSLTKISLEILVDYAYTAQLEIPDALVKDVYLAACQLKIDRVVNECARHLIEELSADSCIEIRSLPGISKNKTFVTAVDDFISKEVCICFFFYRCKTIFVPQVNAIIC